MIKKSDITCTQRDTSLGRDFRAILNLEARYVLPTLKEGDSSPAVAYEYLRTKIWNKLYKDLFDEVQELAMDLEVMRPSADIDVIKDRTKRLLTKLFFRTAD